MAERLLLHVNLISSIFADLNIFKVTDFKAKARRADKEKKTVEASKS